MIKEIFRSYAVFDANGRHTNGTDKQSNHNYSDAYENIFTVKGERQLPELGVIMLNYPHSTRNSVKLMMEIGIADGSSLLAWSEVFPNAQCVGMDIHHSNRARGDRIEFHIGDQRSLHDCNRVAGGRKFDFICEDATHQLPDTLMTLLFMWPHVKQGGLYVIEEFQDIGSLRRNVEELFPNIEIVDTDGPFGNIESLVVLRKR